MLVVLIGFSLSACQSSEVKKYPYLVKVRIEGCPRSIGVLFRPGNNGGDRLDSAKMQQGQLVFKGLLEHLGVYTIYCVCRNSQVTTNLRVYLPTDSVQVTVMPGANLRPDIYQIPGLGAYKVGSYQLNSRLFSTASQQREVASYLITRDSLWNKFFLDKDRAKAKMNAAISAGNKQEIDRWGDSTRLVQEKFSDYLAAASEMYIRRHPRSEVGIFAMLDAGDSPAAVKRLLPYYRAMPAAWQASYFGKIAGERLSAPVTSPTAK